MVRINDLPDMTLAVYCGHKASDIKTKLKPIFRLPLLILDTWSFHNFVEALLKTSKKLCSSQIGDF